MALLRIFVVASVLVVASTLGAAGQTSESSLALGAAAFPGSVFCRDVSAMPVAPYSRSVISKLGDSGLHADFGTMWDGLQNGIPINFNGSIAANVTFDYADESDKGPYLFTAAPNIERSARAGEQPDIDDGRDHHCLTVGKDGKLYELYQARKLSNGSWHAASGAIWTLSSNKMRPDGWTSSDAAGLPIAPLLVKYAEVKSGTISHALRVTVEHTSNSYVWPASHKAGGADKSYPPMGARFRLRPDFNVSPYPVDVQVILRALKKYGMFVADNGSNGYIQGEPNPNWNDEDLSSLKRVHLDDFEIVDEASLQLAPNSYAAR